MYEQTPPDRWRLFFKAKAKAQWLGAHAKRINCEDRLDRFDK